MHRKARCIMYNLYNRIEDLCNKKEIKVGKLCKEIGITQGVLTDLKMGRTKHLSIPTLEKIAEYFGIAVDELLSQQKKADNAVDLTNQEQVILDFYRSAPPEIRAMIDKIAQS